MHASDNKGSRKTSLLHKIIMMTCTLKNFGNDHTKLIHIIVELYSCVSQGGIKFQGRSQTSKKTQPDRVGTSLNV